MMPRMFLVPPKGEPSTGYPSNTETGGSGRSVTMSVPNSRPSRSGDSGSLSMVSLMRPPACTGCIRCPRTAPYRTTGLPSGRSAMAILCPWGMKDRAKSPPPMGVPGARSAVEMAVLSRSSTCMIRMVHLTPLSRRLRQPVFSPGGRHTRPRRWRQK
ncbi:hypothetical protein SDC9_131473 [bioreactor metagenome]|uniref:Uncharacterized protein n=1 Tax=bioreactor metagenome TaxID=1076179 RepID=A0A645D6Z1_9ZZZZ